MGKMDLYHLPVTGRTILKFAFPAIIMYVLMLLKIYGGILF